MPMASSPTSAERQERRRPSGTGNTAFVDRQQIEAVAAAGGLQLPHGVEVQIDGSDPMFPSPHRLGDVGAVACLLAGIGANELWRARTGRSQILVVDARHAAAVLNSWRLFSRLDGGPLPMEHVTRWAWIAGTYAARDDRYVQLHGSFTDGPGVLDAVALGEDANREDLVAVVRGCNAFELEAALISRRVCGTVVRSKEEWQAHPQGQAITGLPAVLITKMGEAPPEPLPAGDRPASGVRVLDLTRVLAGPTSTKSIAEHGADVLHVSAPHLELNGMFEVDTGIGKRQTYLDLREPAQLDQLRALAAECDVFAQGYRLGTLRTRGLGPEDLAALRPGIVYVSENCYGPVGPWAERPGWEDLAQAATGMSWREGLSTGAPRSSTANPCDYVTGMLAAYGAMTALSRRAVEGGSWHVQVSLAQTSMWIQRVGDDNEPAETGDPSPYVTERDTPGFGTIRHVAPALSMSETPPRWDLPPSPLGTHAPEWLPQD
jgi:crotonobetainyl-CoA:carnitine CoA-transferase CaiB-like acyl-CoA transferase